MKKVLRIRAFGIMALLLVGLLLPVNSPAKGTRDGGDPLKRFELSQHMRDLWIGHIFWIRSFVISTYYGDNAAAAVADKKVKANAGMMADSLRHYYGSKSAEEFSVLLDGHYSAVKDYLYAVLSEDTKAGEGAVRSLEANASEMAEFLASANPYFEGETVKDLFSAHVGHHMAQIDMVVAEDFAIEADVWVEMRKNVYKIADSMAASLVK